ncbi:MAG: glycosyltransferase, partial [Micrococcales bacterium]|nr:glycosyltransferase [Micrococcales bacterium]
MKGFEPFSVLLPVYHGDRAKWLDQAIGSALDDQQLRPDQIVVVQDGPVGPKLAAVLDQWAARPEVDHLQLATNQGISAALNAGLKVCRHSIVARCDADDVNLPERFSTQIPMLQAGLDLVGGAMVEFTDQARQAGIGRNYPTGQAEISQFARLHNPFAHPTVVFRRQLVEQAGGYPRLDRLEDYLLWVRLLRRGARVANTDQVVVAYRVSQAAYARRGGAKLV